MPVADPTLTAGQYSIGTEGSSAAFVYGGSVSPWANNIQVSSTSVDTGTVNVQDQAVVGQDGLQFGVDTYPGMVVTQQGQAYSPAAVAAAMDSYSALAGAWNNPAVRLADGAVQVLRAYYRGSSVVRRTYGRGRKIMPSYGMVNQGLVPWTAQFQSADNTWYEDVKSSLTLTAVPSFRGTLAPPWTPPLQLAATSNYQQNTIVNSGSLPTWPVIQFNGPVSYPGITYVNTPVSIGYQGILAAGQSLTIDTRPWARTALLNSGASVAGLLTGSAMLSMQVQPGATVVHYGGQDFTGQSYCVITWRSATLSIGGSGTDTSGPFVIYGGSSAPGVMSGVISGGGS